MANNKLTTIGIKKAPDGKLFDGGGITLVKKGASGKWVYRYSIFGKRREMGLGQWPAVSLAEVRGARDNWAAMLAKDQDPISVRDAQREDAKQAQGKEDPTFAAAVDLVFEARRDGLRGGGSRGRWRSPLDKHIIPKIGHKRLSQLHQTDIKDALSPIWRTKYPTAKKAVERTRIVIRDMQLMGYECDPIAVDRAQHMLGKVMHTSVPIPATPWQEIPALFARLNTGSSSDQCLRWMILTLVRYDGCAGTQQSEIDGDVWTVPADRVKGEEGKVKDFRVPIGQSCMEIAQSQLFVSGSVLFPGDTGGPITSRAIELRLDRIGEKGRPHGFRSSFRTWVQDTDACGWDVSETVLGHKVGNKIERTYARSDLLERRRNVMTSWESFVTGQNTAKVITM